MAVLDPAVFKPHHLTIPTKVDGVWKVFSQITFQRGIKKDQYAFKSVLLLWIFVVVCVSCLSLLSLPCLFHAPFGHLIGMGLPLGFLCVAFSCVTATFPICVLSASVVDPF